MYNYSCTDSYIHRLYIFEHVGLHMPVYILHVSDEGKNTCLYLEWNANNVCRCLLQSLEALLLS